MVSWSGRGGFAAFALGMALSLPISRILLPGSGEVEPVEVHHLVPRGHEVVHKLLLRIRASIDFRQRPELGVRTEDEIEDRKSVV